MADEAHVEGLVQEFARIVKEFAKATEEFVRTTEEILGEPAPIRIVELRCDRCGRATAGDRDGAAGQPCVACGGVLIPLTE